MLDSNSEELQPRENLGEKNIGLEGGVIKDTLPAALPSRIQKVREHIYF